MTSEVGPGGGRTDSRAAFYHAHHPRLVGFIHRRIRDKGEAEALAHETWMAFLRRFDHYRERYDDPVGPLFVIARRMIADWYERQNNVPDLPGDDILGVRIAQIAQDRPNALGRADLRADLTKAINRLTPRQRTALQLYYVDGLDRSAAAQLMDITVDGVKKLISAALKSLRAAQDLANYQPSITISTPTMDSTRKEVRK